MQGSPWMGVLAIAGFTGGGLFLILLIGKADDLRKAANRHLGLPLLIALAAAGVIVGGLILRFGVGPGVVLAVMLGMTLLEIAEAVRPRWAGWLLAIDGIALLGILAWSLVTGKYGFSGSGWSDLIPVAIIAGFLFATGRALYFQIRPRAASLTAQTSETGTPA